MHAVEQWYSILPGTSVRNTYCTKSTAVYIPSVITGILTGRVLLVGGACSFVATSPALIRRCQLADENRAARSAKLFLLSSNECWITKGSSSQIMSGVQCNICTCSSPRLQLEARITTLWDHQRQINGKKTRKHIPGIPVQSKTIVWWLVILYDGKFLGTMLQ